MNIAVTATQLHELETQLLAIGLHQKAQPSPEAGPLPQAVAALDQALNGALQALLDEGDFKGDKGESALYYTRGAVGCKRVLLVGLGEKKQPDVDLWRQASAKAAQRAQKLGLGEFSFCIVDSLEIMQTAQAIVEGAVLGSYVFAVHKTDLEEIKPAPEALTLVVTDACQEAAAVEGARVGQIVADAVCLGRNLVNEPGNYMTPALLGEEAEQLAAEVGLQVRILEEREMVELGMGALLGVAQGSNEPAKLIVLEHNAGRDDLDTYVLVGKGITFDSGGISLKPSQGMQDMKYDMSGAAATVGIMRAVALLDLPLHVVGLVPATENLPGGRAYKPGDVLQSMSGQTIEVISTDAEGRLILADTLTYAQRFQPKAVVDMATLTGGCIVALGHVASGLLGTDAELLADLKVASEETGEKVWVLPLFDEYAEQIKSEVADVKNSGGRAASTITGGMFLSKFATGYAWAHLDIAGTAWAEKAVGYRLKGATGVGVRLLVQWLRNQCQA